MAKEARLTGGAIVHNSGNNVDLDRISELPDHIIICHILSLVPTLYAVRMSALSKRWRRVCYSVPSLEFSDADFDSDMEAFKTSVDKCLTRRHVADAEVTCLKLSFCSGDVNPYLMKWLNSPMIQSRVEELEICLQLNYTKPYVAVNGSSLVILKLMGVKWKDSCSVNLPSLKSLYLIDVDISGKSLSNIVSGCPFLEKCELNDIFSKDTVRISSSSLKFMEIGGCFRSTTVDAENLQSLAIHILSSNIDFSSCGVIRDLALLYRGRHGKGPDFCDQLSKFPFLENLTLYEVYEDIKISSPSLKTFSLTKFHKKEVKITTETPNLVSICYKGSSGLSMSMETPDHELNGQFYIQRTYGLFCDTTWYVAVKQFLSNVNCSWNSVCLHVCDTEGLSIPRGWRTRLKLQSNVKNLKVVFHGPSETKEYQLKRSLQWISPSIEVQSIEKEIDYDLRKWLVMI